VPTSIVVRALTVVAGVVLALAVTSCGPYYPAPAPTQPQAQAQAQGAVVVRSPGRRDLEARAAQLERDPRRRGEVAVIRARLREGDFRVGDAIVLNVVGVPAFSDTFPVRAGQVIQLPEVAPIPLSGVLRTELQPHLRRHIARYVIDPTVEAYSLVRVAVAGAVTRPGFYEVRPDAPVSEAVMSAGGLTPEGDATRMSVRRAGRLLVPESQVRSAVAIGATFDDLSIRPGDELRVGARPQRNWTEVARTAAYVIIAATGLWAAGRN
jgi:protein involved in polysaccharide export with SLBB domain